MFCDATGHVIATVKAHDVDEDENARIRYELQQLRDQAFHLDRRTGELIDRRAGEMIDVQVS